MDLIPEPTLRYQMPPDTVDTGTETLLSLITSDPTLKRVGRGPSHCSSFDHILISSIKLSSFHCVWCFV